jgi:hypothetical protein
LIFLTRAREPEPERVLAPFLFFNVTICAERPA